MGTWNCLEHILTDPFTYINTLNTSEKSTKRLDPQLLCIKKTFLLDQSYLKSGFLILSLFVCKILMFLKMLLFVISN